VEPFDCGLPMDESKTKKIKKAGKMSKYIHFYKENFERMMQAHPTWTAIQITKIVKLLWQREKQNRGAKKMPLFKANPMKNLSGRMIYKRFKLKEGLNTAEIKNKWKHLPMESKKMYGSKANDGMPKQEDKMTKMMTRNMKTNSSLNDILMKK
jgi:hypothetical protein